MKNETPLRSLREKSFKSFRVVRVFRGLNSGKRNHETHQIHESRALEIEIGIEIKIATVFADNTDEERNRLSASAPLREKNVLEHFK